MFNGSFNVAEIINRRNCSGKIINPLNLERLALRRAKSELRAMPKYRRPQNTEIGIYTEFCQICGCVVDDGKHKLRQPCPR